MFTQPCFIRKNTPELIKKLKEFGYKYNDGGIKSNHIVVFVGCIFDIYPLDTIKRGFNNCVDCGDNEELFLALAALRDDTPINSYYWFNDNLFKCEGLEIDRVLKNNTANYLLKCRHVDNSMIISCFKERNVIKATVEEIIEHFKK